MYEPAVYSILQAQKGSKQVSRLLDALEELAGRLESVSAYETGPQPGTKTPASPGSRGAAPVEGGYRHDHGQDFHILQLPDPQAGALPLFPGASEFDALQLAANHTSSQLHSKAERQAWRSWLMRPSHFVRVIEAAWLLLGLVFKQDDACAAPLQAYVFDQLARHYVSEVLAGQAVIKNAAGLWAQALAEAACQLLKAAFPSVAELQDSQLQQVLHRQLRLWITGLLPSDVGAHSLMKAGRQAAAAAGGTEVEGDEVDVVDVDSLVAGQVGSKCAATRCTAPFVSIKPGPLVSAFMADKSLKPAALLQIRGPKLKGLTVPQQQWRQLQQTLDQQKDPLQQRLQCNTLEQQHQPQHIAQSAAATAMKQQRLSSSPGGCNISADHTSAACPAGKEATSPLPPAAAGSSSRRAQAAACVAAAAAAAEQYTHSKQAAAAAASKSSCMLHKQMQQLQMKRCRTLHAGHQKVQTASNQIAGCLSVASGSNTCVASTTTDAQCKAQRQLIESHSRLGDWRMAHTFNATVHDKCLDMAAAVAVLPPPPAANGPSGAKTNSGSRGSVGSAGNSSSGQRYDRPGGGWADIAGCSLVSNRLSSSKNGGGAGSSTKITKAARAIVEDVQRKYAAAPISLSKRI